MERNLERGLIRRGINFRYGFMVERNLERGLIRRGKIFQRGIQGGEA